ncbi:hypothetical protein HanIR_Chr08g0375941 [Helianthus annuus]|nr:hypothetical protein HanIR_Chr08g0375941 [Helianthus annuus]
MWFGGADWLGADCLVGGGGPKVGSLLERTTMCGNWCDVEVWSDFLLEEKNKGLK